MNEVVVFNMAKEPLCQRNADFIIPQAQMRKILDAIGMGRDPCLQAYIQVGTAIGVCGDQVNVNTLLAQGIC